MFLRSARRSFWAVSSAFIICITIFLVNHACGPAERASRMGVDGGTAAPSGGGGTSNTPVATATPLILSYSTYPYYGSCLVQDPTTDVMSSCRDFFKEADYDRGAAWKTNCAAPPTGNVKMKYTWRNEPCPKADAFGGCSTEYKVPGEAFHSEVDWYTNFLLTMKDSSGNVVQTAQGLQDACLAPGVTPPEILRKWLTP